MQENQSNVSMATKRAVIIDLDGTLLDDFERHYRCYCDIVDMLGGDSLAFETYIERKRKKTPLSEILSASCLKGEDSMFSQLFLERIESRTYLAYESLALGAEEFLDGIDKMGMDLILVTMRKNGENLEWQLKNLGIYKYFKAIVTHISKTEIKMGDFGLDQAKYVVGDTEEDERLAKNLRVSFIAVLTGMRDIELLHADYYVSNLADILSIIKESYGEV